MNCAHLDLCYLTLHCRRCLRRLEVALVLHVFAHLLVLQMNVAFSARVSKCSREHHTSCFTFAEIAFLYEFVNYCV